MAVLFLLSGKVAGSNPSKGLFRVEFACSLCGHVGFLWWRACKGIVPPNCKNEADVTNDTLIIKKTLCKAMAVMTQRWRWRYGCHNKNKPTPVMKTDLHCSTLHQVWPHCAPVRARFHYSSLNQWVWWWKKRWKAPPFPFPTHIPKNRNQFHLLDRAPLTGCLAFYWCSSHTNLTPL